MHPNLAKRRALIAPPFDPPVLFYLVLHLGDNLSTSNPPDTRSSIGGSSGSFPVNENGVVEVMSVRRYLPLVCVAAAILLTVFLAGRSNSYGDSTSQDSLNGTALTVSVMKAALRTTTPSEGRFVERVVRLANKGTLPVDMVASTFQWARKKPNLQFQYFKWGITSRASKMDVTL